MAFHDRIDAGRRLAAALAGLRDQNVVVLGLPRGGVPVAAEVARALRAPLDVIVVRKVGVPWQPELAMGAVGEAGANLVNTGVVSLAGVKPEELGAAQAHARVEVQHRLRALRGDRPPAQLSGRTALVVDDGIATGSTARAACRIARSLGAARVVLAVPVGPPDAVRALSDVADEVVCLQRPASFGAVGQFYDDFTPTSDHEVSMILERAAAADLPADRPAAEAGGDVIVEAGATRLAGRLTVPQHAAGLVVFAHGSGSSRHSPRNRQVARTLHRAGLATLLFDLLTPDEELHRGNVFDIELLAGRLTGAVHWVRARPVARQLPVGLFGASTGAAAALWAAADPALNVGAVVSRGGRPDLAGPRLGEVQPPTLLIVGSLDRVVLDLNRAADARLRCPHRLAVVPGASHQFDEPGALDAAARLATGWFTEHLGGARADGRPAMTGPAEPAAPNSSI